MMPSKNNRIFLSILSALLCSFPALAPAQSLDELKSKAEAFESERDCEGAYKTYEEMRSRASKNRSLSAYIATKLSKLKPCFEKCTPSPEETAGLQKVEEFEKGNQIKRAHETLLRLLRGKSVNCSSWKDAFSKRAALAARLPKKRGVKQDDADPCSMEDGTKDQIAQLRQKISTLQLRLDNLQQTDKIPPDPPPPSWAKSERQKQRWLNNWRRRQERKLRAQAEKHQGRRLQEILVHYRKINEYREQLFTWRESFQNCDEVYTDLKNQSDSLRKTQDDSHKAVVGMYDSQVKSIQGKMNWFAKQYRTNKGNQKTDGDTIQSLRNTLQNQRELLDNVSQDLLALSTLLVFKPNQGTEGTLLSNSLGSMQSLMNDQQKMLETMQKQYPQYMQSGQGRRALQQHIATLERFEKVLERFQGQQAGPKSEELEKTLQSVRASILLFEKADESLAQKPVTAAPSSGGLRPAHASADASGNVAGSNRSSWGWLLLLSGLLLGVGAIGYLLYERNRRSMIVE